MKQIILAPARSGEAHPFDDPPPPTPSGSIVDRPTGAAFPDSTLRMIGRQKYFSPSRVRAETRNGDSTQRFSAFLAFPTIPQIWPDSPKNRIRAGPQTGGRNLLKPGEPRHPDSPKSQVSGVEVLMTEQKATNVTWHEHSVSSEDRCKLGGHKGAVLWFTGLSACGKSTVANEVDYKLNQVGKRTYVLDGDNIRMGLNKNLGFSAEDRAENIRRIGEVSKLFADAGVITTTAFISPYRADRDAVRALLPEGQFIEIFVNASLETCEARDPKGLYKKARAGEIKGFTGIDDPYEEPEKAELILDADNKGVEELANEVIDYLKNSGIL